MESPDGKQLIVDTQNTKPKVTFQHIFKTLIEIDPEPLAEYKPVKNKREGTITKLPFIEWHVILRQLNQLFDDVRYQYIINENGTPLHPAGQGFFVRTFLSIEGHIRESYRAVTNQMQTILLDPNAGDVNYNIQRCFARNAELFGFGITLRTLDKEHEQEYQLQETVKKSSQSTQRQPLSIMHSKKTPQQIEKIQNDFINALKSCKDIGALKQQGQLMRIFMQQNNIEKNGNWYEEAKSLYENKVSELWIPPEPPSYVNNMNQDIPTNERDIS